MFWFCGLEVGLVLFVVPFFFCHPACYAPDKLQQFFWKGKRTELPKTFWTDKMRDVISSDCVTWAFCCCFSAWGLFSAAGMQLLMGTASALFIHFFLALEHLCSPMSWQGPCEWGAFCKWGHVKTLIYDHNNVLSQLLSATYPNGICCYLGGEAEPELTAQFILIAFPSLRAWTKLLVLVLQEFRGGNQQSPGLLYSTFQTINMTFSELKITGSINYQSGLSKKKRVSWLKTFEGTSPLAPVK